MLAEAMLNEQAPRGRMGRSAADQRRRDHLAYAKRCLNIWQEWTVNQDDRGWPSESSEVRAAQSKQATTDTRGDAAYRGRVEVAEGADGKIKTVPKDPPPFPKETRATAGSRVPNIDLSRVGPRIERALLDLAELGGGDDARVLRMHFLAGNRPAGERAEALGISPRTYWNRYSRGLAWMAGRLSAS